MTPVIAIFDIGKTNKKLFLFNERYEIVWEKTEQFDESIDDDGYPCEDLTKLTRWITTSLEQVVTHPNYDVRALNFSTYGASLVYLNEANQPVGFLYNYLKPFPTSVRTQFYEQYGTEATMCLETSSPALDSLNSGLMLYRIKYDKPQLFEQIRYALHLPQYVSFLITRQVVSDVTSIGCHTMLWDFSRNQYHSWVTSEGLDQVLGPLSPSDSVTDVTWQGHSLKVGGGLHDSSAALIPYLASFREPFVLISTGTWCISLNPFNENPLTVEELQYDSLCFLHYKGKPVKASRLFAGYEHEQQTKRLAEHFQTDLNYYRTVAFDPEIIQQLRNYRSGGDFHEVKAPPLQESLFGHRNLADFTTYEEAYHQLILDIIAQQLISTNLVLANSSNSQHAVKRIFVDGGFSKNPIYMNLLAAAFPEMEVFAASVAQATALGAALAIHRHWNEHPIPSDCIDLKYYAPSQQMVL
ncbi:FGGY-family carbohydrate kinase [Spirosoma validum]|uniref:Carbohydrate kinase n=1 Tax=Spirosoma validum TaxID=2771355 RepID=A0A927GE37_9BACT|nr:FGGY family carbohydrate kinase [Spirosoma validum]MBD2754298.1 carbohydrate kinase [Spirosoma validum]